MGSFPLGGHFIRENVQLLVNTDHPITRQQLGELRCCCCSGEDVGGHESHTLPKLRKCPEEANALLMSGVRGQNAQRPLEGNRKSDQHWLQPRSAEQHLCTHNTSKVFLMKWLRPCCCFSTNPPQTMEYNWTVYNIQNMNQNFSLALFLFLIIELHKNPEAGECKF